MKIFLLVVLFLAFFATEEISAQRRWITIQVNPVTIEVDPNVRRLPNGNLIYWARYGGFLESQTEVDCVKRQSRTLARKEYDSYGNVTENSKEVEGWRNDNDSMGSNTNATVCRAHPREKTALTSTKNSKSLSQIDELAEDAPFDNQFGKGNYEAYVELLRSKESISTEKVGFGELSTDDANFIRIYIESLNDTLTIAKKSSNNILNWKDSLEETEKIGKSSLWDRENQIVGAIYHIKALLHNAYILKKYNLGGQDKNIEANQSKIVTEYKLTVVPKKERPAKLLESAEILIKLVETIIAQE